MDVEGVLWALGLASAAAREHFGALHHHARQVVLLSSDP